MIEIKNLHKSYKRGKEVIPQLNLKFGDAGLVMIVGKSGCGKTTLLNIMGSMDLDYKGEVTVDGKELRSMSYKEIVDYRNFKTAFVFQISSLFEFMTVEENLRLCLNIQGNDADINDALEKVGLKGFNKKKVKALSGGEKQRVAIARALVKDCQIVFADEPTSALDTKNAHRIFKLFKEISQDRLVILVTHDVKKAVLYADRIVQMVDGVPVSDVVYRETSLPAKKLTEKHAKPFPLLPVFKNHLKVGLVMNIFIVALIVIGLTCFNIAVAEKKVKKEYDNYGTLQQPEFNVDRAIETQRKNKIDLFKVVKGCEESPFAYLENPDAAYSFLNKGDELILKCELKDYELYQGSNDPFFPHLVIDTISPFSKENVEYEGRKCYWEKIRMSNYGYYLYDENYRYDLLKDGRSRLPDPAKPEEIMVTDVVAWNWICNNYDRMFAKPEDPQEIPVSPDDLDIFHIIYENIFTIYDTNGKTDDGYYMGNFKEYKVVGVIDTGLLKYYNYDYKSFIFKKEFKNQDGDRRATFMVSGKSQPFGYVILQKPLLGSVNNPFLCKPFELQNIVLHAAGDAIDSYTKSIAYFTGEPDIHLNPAEEYYRKKENLSGTHKEYELGGYIDNIYRDVKGRIIFKSDSLKERIDLEKDDAVLTDGEVLIPKGVLLKMYPGLEDFKDAENTEIKFCYNNDMGEIDLRVAGVVNDDNFYVSEDVFKKLSQDNFDCTRDLMLNLHGVSSKERKKLMLKLQKRGYYLKPVEMMPGAYLEFVKGKGETYAEVDGDGLCTLYPDYKIIDMNGIKYFQNDNYIFGPIQQNPDESVKIVYMKSSTIKKIKLDDSYIINDLGNLSPYYLFSRYYTFDDTLQGNNLTEIIASMYGFLFALTMIISIGFVFLRENREKDTMTKLSMLGARPKSIYLIHAINYLLLSVIIFFGSVLFTYFAANYINGLYKYSFPSGAVIYRIRLMFENKVFVHSLVFSGIFYLLAFTGSVLVTDFSRK